MNSIKVIPAKTPNFLINHRNGQLEIRTATGSCRLAIIDDDGNLLACDNIEEMITDAAFNALFDVIGPELAAHSRRLNPPPR